MTEGVKTYVPIDRAIVVEILKTLPFRLAASLTAVEKARLELQSGIVQHTQTILDMKHQLNALAPTAVLPPELLAEVFIYLAHTNSTIPRAELRHGSLPSGINATTPAFFPYSWITVTHINILLI